MKRFFHDPARKSRRGFTLVELLIGATIASVISLGLYSVMQAGMIVGVRSLAINNTGNAARAALDHVERYLQVAYDVPTPILRTGALQDDATVPAAGVRFFRYAGGPYEIDIPNTGLSGETETLSVFARKAGAGTNEPPAPLVPGPNDVLVINTTILMSGSSSQIYAYIEEITETQNQTRTTTAGSSVNGVRYTLKLTQALTDNGGMIPHGTTSTVTAVLLRPTAFVVVPNGENRELRLYESYPDEATLDITQDHTVLTRQIALPEGTTSASANDSFATPFLVRRIGNKTFIDSHLRVRNDRYGRYLEASNRNDFSTYTALNSRVPVKCNPNEP